MSTREEVLQLFTNMTPEAARRFIAKAKDPAWVEAYGFTTDLDKAILEQLCKLLERTANQDSYA